MNDKNIEEFVEILYPFILKRIEKDELLKNYVKRKTATVTSQLEDGNTNIGLRVYVSLPYDDVSFLVRNETGYDLNEGDLVCIEYNIDLKNAMAVYKI